MKRIMVIVVVLMMVAVGCHKAYDFDGDQKADRVVKQSNGEWRIYPFSSAANPSPGSPVIYTGDPTDLAVPADYDGDGRTDVAVVHPNGDWLTISSLGTVAFPAPPNPGAGYPTYFQVLPVPADYDGDHHADPAWYRDSDGTWFIRGQAPIVFGQGPTAVAPSSIRQSSNAWRDQDIAVPADYDGDGKADLATYNPRSRVWRVRNSSDLSVTSVTMPGSNDKPAYPVPGRYDSSVYHAQRALFGTEGWIIEGHATPIVDPVPVDEYTLPAPADYNGDGILERASFYNSYLRGTGPNEVFDVAIGPPQTNRISADIPVELPTALLLNYPRITLTWKNCLPGPFHVDC